MRCIESQLDFWFNPLRGIKANGSIVELKSVVQRLFCVDVCYLLRVCLHCGVRHVCVCVCVCVCTHMCVCVWV